MKRSSTVIVGVAASFVLLAATWLAVLSPVAADPVKLVATGTNSNVHPFDRTMGSSKAPILLIEYSSPTCPHCAAFFEHYFQFLKRKFIDAGQVRFVYRAYMLRPDDASVEKLSRCFPSEYYFDFVGLLMQKQPEWDAVIYPNINMHDALIQIAERTGLPRDRAEKCISDNALNRQLNQVSEEGEQRYHVAGTPTFVVNGVSGEAGEPWEHLEKRLAAALLKGEPTQPN